MLIILPSHPSYCFETITLSDRRKNNNRSRSKKEHTRKKVHQKVRGVGALIEKIMLEHVIFDLVKHL